MKILRITSSITLIVAFICICNELFDSKAYCPECNRSFTGREIVRAEGYK